MARIYPIRGKYYSANIYEIIHSTSRCFLNCRDAISTRIHRCDIRSVFWIEGNDKCGPLAVPFLPCTFHTRRILLDNRLIEMDNKTPKHAYYPNSHFHIIYLRLPKYIRHFLASARTNNQLSPYGMLAASNN